MIPKDHIISNKTTSAILYDNGWVFVCWMNDKIGRLPIRLIKDLIKIESIIQQEKYNGWFCNSEIDHIKMHDIIRRKGGKEFNKDNHLIWFKKGFKYV